MVSNDTSHSETSAITAAPGSLEDELAAFKKNIDTFYLIITGSIIFFLQAGFAFYESGVVRSKNVTSVLFRNYMDTSISCLFYLLFGYALAFGGSLNGFCGTEYFALVGLPEEKMAHCFFQYTFAACAVTIISGAVHERCTMTAYFAYTILHSALVYPIISHWAWSQNGWLYLLGYQDFAGSAVVHATGGAAALAAAIMAGPRLGRYEKNGEMNPMLPHSVPQATLGSFIFLFGIISFNAGSNLTISLTGDGAIVSKVVINTMICVAAATVTALIYQRFFTASGRLRKNWSFMNAMNGSFVGMVVSCGGCNQYPPWGALVVGILSYFVYLLVYKISNHFRIDDVANAVPVHLGAGYFGAVGTAIFGEKGVILSPSTTSATMLLMNAMGGLVICAWSFSLTLVLYIALRYFNLHRVSEPEEKLGLDLAVHDLSAYNVDEPMDPMDSTTTTAYQRGSAKVTPEGSAGGQFRGLRRIISVPHIHAW